MQMDAIFSRISYVHIIMDDIFIASETKEGDDRAIQQIITTSRAGGVHLNGNNCHLIKDRIEFVGPRGKRY